MKISVLALFLIIAGLEPNIHGQNHVPLRLVRTLTMPKVQGRIDHMALDAERGRLFVAALGNGTLEVLNLRTGTVAQSVAGMKDPQGVVYISETGRFFVTTGGDGKCHVFSGDPLRPVAAIHIGEDADNIRYDASAKRLYVGYGNGALAVIDPSTLKRLGDIKLSGHPESFQLERGGPKIYVNVPDAGHVAVLDRLKLSVLSTWPLKDLHANFPMALIEGDRRIVIAARRPAKLVVIDAGSGKSISELDCAGDADDLFYDSEKKLVYVSCGEGGIDVFAKRDPDRYQETARIPTAAGARTCLWAADLQQLFLAVPARGGQQASIRIYQPD